MSLAGDSLGGVSRCGDAEWRAGEYLSRDAAISAAETTDPVGDLTGLSAPCEKSELGLTREFLLLPPFDFLPFSRVGVFALFSLAGLTEDLSRFSLLGDFRAS